MFEACKRLDKSMTSNPIMRGIIEEIKDNHDSVMTQSPNPMQDKTRLDKKRKELPTRQAVRVPYQEILEKYHKQLPELPGVKVLSEARKRQLKARWLGDQKRQSVDYWDRLFAYIAKSDFLMGKSTEWQANFDFIIKEANFIKIIEEAYHDK